MCYSTAFFGWITIFSPFGNFYFFAGFSQQRIPPFFVKVRPHCKGVWAEMNTISVWYRRPKYLPKPKSFLMWSYFFLLYLSFFSLFILVPHCIPMRVGSVIWRRLWDWGGVGLREFSQPPWWLAWARFHPLNGSLVCTRRREGDEGWDRTRLDARTSDLWPRVAEVRSTPLKARCWGHYPHHPIVMMILKRPCSSLCWSRRSRVLLPSLIPPAFSSTHR